MAPLPATWERSPGWGHCPTARSGDSGDGRLDAGCHPEQHSTGVLHQLPHGPKSPTGPPPAPVAPQPQPYKLLQYPAPNFGVFATSASSDGAPSSCSASLAGASSGNAAQSTGRCVCECVCARSHTCFFQPHSQDFSPSSDSKLLPEFLICTAEVGKALKSRWSDCKIALTVAKASQLSPTSLLEAAGPYGQP